MWGIGDDDNCDKDELGEDWWAVGLFLFIFGAERVGRISGETMIYEEYSDYTDDRVNFTFAVHVIEFEGTDGQRLQDTAGSASDTEFPSRYI